MCSENNQKSWPGQLRLGFGTREKTHMGIYRTASKAGVARVTGTLVPKRQPHRWALAPLLFILHSS